MSDEENLRRKTLELLTEWKKKEKEFHKYECSDYPEPEALAQTLCELYGIK